MEFCPSCGRLVSPEASYCPACSATLRRTSSYSSSRQPYYVETSSTPRKNPRIAAALALVAGFFGIWGLGHIYAGSIAKGIGLFVAGAIIGGLFWLSVILTLIVIGYVGMAIFGILFIGGWLWQAMDAYSAAQEYNELHSAPVHSRW
jgi:TM2 domain-containing membrane protein YozV